MYYIICIIISGLIYCFVSNNGIHNHEFQVSNKNEFQNFETEQSTDLINKLKRDLVTANEKIEQLENKMQGFEERIRKPYPNVKYLNYRSKKRILVR